MSKLCGSAGLIASDARSEYDHILMCLWPFWLVFFAAGKNPAHEVVSSRFG